MKRAFVVLGLVGAITSAPTVANADQITFSFTEEGSQDRFFDSQAVAFACALLPSTRIESARTIGRLLGSSSPLPGTERGER